MASGQRQAGTVGVSSDRLAYPADARDALKELLPARAPQQRMGLDDIVEDVEKGRRVVEGDLPVDETHSARSARRSTAPCHRAPARRGRRARPVLPAAKNAPRPLAISAIEKPRVPTTLVRNPVEEQEVLVGGKYVGAAERRGQEGHAPFDRGLLGPEPRPAELIGCDLRESNRRARRSRIAAR